MPDRGTGEEQVEGEMQGRVFGVQGIVSSLAMPIGMLVFGPMADVISIEWITIIAGLLMLGVTVVVGYRAPRALAPEPVSSVSSSDSSS